MHGRGVCGGVGACVVGGMHGMWDACQGACVAGGCAWQGVCMTGEGHAWQGEGAYVAGGLHGRGTCMAGACMVGRGRAWLGACAWWGEGRCVAGKTAIAAGGTHSTGMHSCIKLESQSHHYLLEMKCCRHPVSQYVQNFNLVDTTNHAIDATESLKIAKTNFKTSLSYFSQNCKVHTFSSMGQIQNKVLITLPFFCFLNFLFARTTFQNLK